MDIFKVISTDGYDDGYYWDMRIYFAYDGNEYTYVNMGSQSRWIPIYEAIKKGCDELPVGNRDSRFVSDVVVNRNELIKFVEMLLSSGEDEYVIREE